MIHNHPSEHTLELYILGSTSIAGDEREAIAAHLTVCEGCRDLKHQMEEFYSGLHDELEKMDDRLPVIHRDELPRKAHRGIGNWRADRLPIHEVETRLPFKIARWIVRHPMAAASGGVMLMGALAVLLLLSRPGPEEGITDRNPYSVVMRGIMLQVQNRHGQKIAEIETSPSLAQTYNYDRSFFPRKVLITDVDADGTNELIWLDTWAEGIKFKFIIHCVGFGNDPINWESDLSRTTTASDGRSVVIFSVASIYARDLDRNRIPEVYAILSSTGAPSRILKLDAGTGMEVGFYQHNGGLLSIEFADVVGDSVNEIIAGGMNNTFNEAALVILDPRRISGYSPHLGEALTADVTPAYEKAYLRLPRTIVGLSDPLCTRNRVMGVDVVGSDRIIRVSLLDNPEASSQQTDYHITLDRNLAIISIEPGDGYNNMADSLFRAGRIPILPDEGYFEGYQRTISWWDGVEWKHTPAWNTKSGELRPPS